MSSSGSIHTTYRARAMGAVCRAPQNGRAGDEIAQGLDALLQVGDQAGEGRLADTATTFMLTPNGNIVFTSASGVIGAITVAAKNQGTGYFYVKGVAAGTGTVSITNASYQPYSNSVTVTP